MPEYDFVLVLAGISTINEEQVNALLAAGCDDATVSVRSGRVYVAFSRQAASLKDAIISAICDVRHASIGADVLRIDDCCLVTQSEIARKLDRSRQLIHQYVTGDRGDGKFPPPACKITEDAPLWYWCEVAEWARLHDMLRDEDVQVARDIAIINSVLEWNYLRSIDSHLVDEVWNSVGDCGCEPETVAEHG